MRNNSGDFGNTIVSAYDYGLGFSFKKAVSRATPKIVKKVVRVAAKPVKVTAKITAATAKVAPQAAIKGTVAAAKLTVKTAVLPTNVAIATVTKGPKGGLTEVKTGTKEQLRDVRDIRSAGATATAPVRKEAGKDAGQVWESKIGKLTRSVVFNKYTDPGTHIKQSHKLFNKMPIVGPAYNTIDKYSGNTLSQIETASQVSGKLGRGEPVTKAELITAAMVAVKAGAIAAAAFTGGASMAAIAVMSTLASSCKQGPLGATKEGRALLTVAEVAGYVYMGYSAAATSAAGAATAGAGASTAAAGTAATQAGTQAAAQAAQTAAMQAGSAAARAAAQAGASAAQQAAVQAVTQGVVQKTQSIITARVANEVVKRTNTGVLGEIAVSAAIGPGTVQQSLEASAKSLATKEAAKTLGPEAGMIAGAAIAATTISSAAPGQLSKSESFTQAFQAEIQARARAEAQKRAEDEIKKTVGGDAGNLLIAGTKGESLTAVAGVQLSAVAQKQAMNQLKINTNSVVALNKQKDLLSNQLLTMNPAQRVEGYNQLVDIDTKVVKLQAQRNVDLQSLGYSPSKQQAQLTENAKVGGVSISKTPNFSLTQAQRDANEQLTLEVEETKLENLNSKFYGKALAVNVGVGKLKELADQATTLKEAGKLKEAEAIEYQMVDINAQVEKDEASTMAFAQAIEAQKIQSSLRVAAAKEGRYTPMGEFQHPLAVV